MTRSLTKDAAQIRKITDAALNVSQNINSIETVPRTYVAELLVVRLFSMYEIFVENVSCRMVCGYNYCDGSKPDLLRERPAAGSQRALQAMRNFNRDAPHYLLRWSKPSEIKKNLECLFPSSEHFLNSLSNHGNVISDVRKIRNHIAHGNVGTRRAFNAVVRNYYGADINSMTPGKLLLTPRFEPILVEQFCRTIRIVLLESIKA